uniref:Short-chain dehydrogenase n=1 Tax=Candidatus Kentrum sp. LFY TaxID=2126342 RepID=A0A450UL47_9GAMM|nr:MAG: Short-chain dehydrogenase [Candidatus Kentron sp. LFY]VFJ93266.1 MAG: Short-chain dehydrogenase [Candidatus Kentron sp. LFY]
MNPQGKVVWITGASSGIGEALALRMAAAGARLILSARREDVLRDVAVRCEDMGVEARILPLDLADLESLPSKAQAAWSLFGGIDILVNNAGISQRALVMETVHEVDEIIMRVNYFGTVVLTKAILPGMIGRNGGQIVVTSSVLGKCGVQTRAAYAASKHALHGFFDALRCEMAIAKHPIVITLVCPGWVRTNVSLEALEGDGTRHGRMDAVQDKGMPPEKFAGRMFEAIAGNKDEVVIGGIETYAVLGKRFVPGLLNKILPGIEVT